MAVHVRGGVTCFNEKMKCFVGPWVGSPQMQQIHYGYRITCYLLSSSQADAVDQRIINAKANYAFTFMYVETSSFPELILHEIL